MKKSIIALLLCLIFIILSSCARTDSVIPKETDVIKETEHDFISDSQTDYSIVISNTADGYELFAAEELKQFFKESTGITLDIVSDEGIILTADSKYLSIGQNALLNQTDISVAGAAIKSTGFKIVTVNKSVFIIGGKSAGTLQGVYKFLNKQFNYRSYASDEIAIDKNVTDKKLLDFNIFFNPSIEILQAHYQTLENDLLYAKRMGYFVGNELWMYPDGDSSSWVHNSFIYVPKEKYFNSEDPDNYHPEWYSSDQTQLCYSCDDEELFNVILEKMKSTILTSSESACVISLTQEDIYSWCGCDKCKAEYNKYGTNLAVMIKYMNKLSRAIKQWQTEIALDKKVYLLTFSYHLTEGVPVTYNAGTDTYTPIDESVKCENNVCIMYAPIRAHYNVSFSHEKNANVASSLKGLSAICDNIALWSYSTNFISYLLNMNTFNGMQGTYKFASDCNVFLSFNQGQYNNGACSFEQLRIFLDSNLMRNADADMNLLIDDFFENYFKDASPAMKKYFEGMRTLYAYNENELGLLGDCMTILEKNIYWPREIILTWLEYTRQAYASIEHYKATDNKLYTKLYDRICRESISLRYLMISFYSSSYTPNELHQMKVAFKKDCQRLGIINKSEAGSLSSLYFEWGI